MTKALRKLHENPSNVTICEFTINLALVMPIMHVFKKNNVALQFCAVDRLSNMLELENERGPPPGRTPALDDVLSYYQTVLTIA